MATEGAAMSGPSQRLVGLTLPQLRMINVALAMYEAEDHDYEGEPYRQDVMTRTRRAVWDALGDDV